MRGCFRRAGRGGDWPTRGRQAAVRTGHTAGRRQIRERQGPTAKTWATWDQAVVCHEEGEDVA